MTISMSPGDAVVTVAIEDTPFTGNASFVMGVADSITEAQAWEIAGALLGVDYVTSKMSGTPAVNAVYIARQTQLEEPTP